MDSFGKIMVVVAVLSVILIGFYLYMFLIDRKLSHLEKELSEKKERPGS